MPHFDTQASMLDETAREGKYALDNNHYFASSLGFRIRLCRPGGGQLGTSAANHCFGSFYRAAYRRTQGSLGNHASNNRAGLSHRPVLSF